HRRAAARAQREVMARRTVQLDSQTIVASMDDAPPTSAAERISALAVIEVRDELTGEAPLAPVSVSTRMRGAVVREGPNGVCGLVGVPRRVFPRLATQSYQVQLRVSALRYVPQDVIVGVGPVARFPAEFAAPPPVVVNLRREPVIV